MAQPNPILLVLLAMPVLSACATIRVTDPYANATQQFLESEASRQAIGRLAAGPLRDRKVYVDASYLTGAISTSPSNLLVTQPPTPELLFVLGELRAHLLNNGVRLTDNRDDAEIILEVRSGGVSIDHTEFLLGVPAITLTANAAVTPELAIVKTTKQQGFASVGFVAFWRDTGEIVASSGPFVGRTVREDYWLFGSGPNTLGNIPPAMAGPATSQPSQ